MLPLFIFLEEKKAKEKKEKGFFLFPLLGMFLICQPFLKWKKKTQTQNETDSREPQDPDGRGGLQPRRPRPARHPPPQSGIPRPRSVHGRRAGPLQLRRPRRHRRRRRRGPQRRDRRVPLPPGRLPGKGRSRLRGALGHDGRACRGNQGRAGRRGVHQRKILLCVFSFLLLFRGRGRKESRKEISKKKTHFSLPPFGNPTTSSPLDEQHRSPS